MRVHMVEIKCQDCGQYYEEGTDHQCEERRKKAEELAKAGEDSGHPDD